ncbi:CoxG family protein [Pseudorhodoplanes sp.]|uniref:CoxG family protein n=1 Tax=Pseudorhodoplanes sp. TaxID=1934341 RepID=UPI003D0A7B03
MTLDGTFAVAAPRERVWRSLRDPAIVAACVPGCSGVEVVSPNAYRATIAVSLGPISATFDLAIDIMDETPPEKISMRTRGAEGGRASMLSAVSVVTLQEAGNARTEVHYTSNVSLTGRFGKFGLGVFRKKADQLANDFSKRFADSLQTAEAS